MLFARVSAALGLLLLPPLQAWGAPSVVEQRDDLAGVLKDVAAALASSQPKADVKAMVATIQANAAQIDGSHPAAVTKTKRAFQSVQAACAISKLIFPSGYSDAKSANYTLEEDHNWSTNCWLPAACFVSLQNTVQVAVALKIVTLTGATFAVRGVGHNQNPGFASTTGGVLLDLQQMKSLNLAGDTLQTGPAATWGEVYAYLDPYGVSAIGGRQPQIGVAGLILNGGLGYFPNTYGWACDNVKNFEVVLSSGLVINANAQSFPDLYKALKGGANNFGIVTRFDLYTRPIHDVWFTLQTYSAANYQDFFRAVAATQALLEKDDKGALLIQGSPQSFLVGFFYAAPSATTPAAFAPMFSGTVQPLAPVVPPTNGNVNSLTQVLGKLPDPPLSHYLASAATSVNSDAYIAAWQAYLQRAPGLATVTPGNMASFSMSTVGTKLATVGQATGGDSLGLKAIPQLLVSVKANYADASATSAVGDAVDATLAAIRGAYQAAGTLQSFIFQGEASSRQNVLAPSGNVPQLRAVSQKYDRGQFFQNLQQGGFLVKNA